MKLALILIPAILCAQEAEKTITFQHPKTPEQAGELATALTLIGQLKAQVTEAGIVVTGTPAQIDFAAWAVPQLEPAGHAASADFPLAGEKVRILHVAQAPSKQAFQEMATAMRSVTVIRQLAAYYSTGSIILRAPPADLDAAEWIWDQLDRATPAKPTQTHKRPIPASPSREDLQDTFAVFSVTRSTDVRGFQGIVTAVRSIVELPFIFSYYPSQSIVVRGPASSMDMVTWLVRQLDQSPVPNSTSEFRSPAVDDAINIFYLPASTSLTELQERATQIRDAANIRRLYSYLPDRALLVRGTASQLAQARRLLAPSN